MGSVTYDPTPVLDELAGYGLKWNGQTGSARCPVHEDRRASLSVSLGRNGGLVLHCHTGTCGNLDIMGALGLPVTALFPPREQQPQRLTDDDWMPCQQDRATRQPIPGHRKVASYVYRDQHGAVVLGVARCEAKDFYQWRPDPASKTGRRWKVTFDDGTRAGDGIPYRLPDLLANLRRPFMDQLNVWIVEGEKDADRLWSLGYPATCNAGGAGKWTEAHAAWLSGADVMIAVDRDDAGWAHAEHVANTLMPNARSIEIVRAAEGKDVSDHLDAGHGPHQFIRVAEPKPAPDADEYLAATR